jgi:hypothetical protein
VSRGFLSMPGVPGCLSLIGSHFLFCTPWPSTGDACGGNPFDQAIGFAEYALDYINGKPDVCFKILIP